MLPSIFKSLKILYDNHYSKLKIFVSSSSSLELLDKTGETLASRVQIFRIYPFSLSEASFLKGSTITLVRKQFIKAYFQARFTIIK
ncbi:MAG: AAA family ATPase [Candidatus Tectomicrobia bacterium]|uniref:AAA family ATPase n=1 Tax=Tectimicrobiota bacterium TaxID=2528274 RepID=A0A933GL09_UNCTE|nr:AAA family ATPase [Candidatus Tectomicrobia bacterium]